jgi:predicted Zn-dependent protease
VTSPAVAETLAVLSRLDGGRFEEVEVYAKRGRSRRLERRDGRSHSTTSKEQGWAVRAGDPRGSFFAAGEGPPRPDAIWPEADGRPLRLPAPVVAPPWKEPSDFDAPLIGEAEGHTLLEAISRALKEELGSARLMHAALEDGAFEVEIASRRNVAARHRGRLAALRLEARDREKPEIRAELYLAEREARRFEPGSLARRLADLLTVQRLGRPRQRDRGELLLAPPVMIRMLEGLLPLFVGPAAGRRAAEMSSRRGRLGSEALTVLDDGRLAGGVLEAPVDGEGVATREVIIADRGKFRQALVPWWQGQEGQARPIGCSRRPGWRDLPRAGATHLYLRPRPNVRASELLQEVARGYYLLDATGQGQFEFDEDSFQLPVCGFEVRGGRATSPVTGTHLCGSITAFLHGLQGVARDLQLLPFGAMIGSPSALLTGLELRGPA